MLARIRPICFFLSLTLFAAVLLPGCGSSKNEESAPPAASISHGKAKQEATTFLSPGAKPVVVNTEALKQLTSRPETPDDKYDLNPVVEMVTNHGVIRIKLNREKAPRTVENFLDNYVARSFYDQTVFQYVDNGVMLAGGGYTPDLQLKTPREDIRNEATNGLKNKAGTICMARFIDAAHSSNSQFIINLRDNPELDHKSTNAPEEYGFCVFGEVIEGMEVLQKISEVDVIDKENFPKTPVNPVIVESVTRVPSAESAANAGGRIK